MTERWGDWAIVVFSMSVLAWVIFRMTSTVVRLARRDKDEETDDA